MENEEKPIQNDLECFELRFKTDFNAEQGKVLLESLIEYVKDVKECMGIELELVGMRKSRGGRPMKPISSAMFKGSKILLADAQGNVRSVKELRAEENANQIKDILSKPINLARPNDSAME